MTICGHDRRRYSRAEDTVVGTTHLSPGFDFASHLTTGRG
jgi:hypothetical protein